MKKRREKDIIIPLSTRCYCLSIRKDTEWCGGGRESVWEYRKPKREGKDRRTHKRVGIKYNKFKYAYRLHTSQAKRIHQSYQLLLGVTCRSKQTL